MTYAELVARRNALNEELSDLMARLMIAAEDETEELQREIERVSERIEDVERLMKTAPIDCPACKGRGDR